MPLRRSYLSVAAFAALGVLGSPAFCGDASAQEQVVQLPPAPPPVTAPAQPPPTVVIQYQQQAPYQAPVYQAPPQAPATNVFPQQGFSGPRIIRDWDDSRPIPPGYHAEERARLGLVIGGAVTFGTMYLFTALGASISNDAGTPANALYVPGVGPFIQMAQCQGCSATGSFFLAVDGVVQVGGIAMFIAGLAAPKTVLVRNDFGLDLHFVPVVARDRTGLALLGRF